MALHPVDLILSLSLSRPVEIKQQSRKKSCFCMFSLNPIRKCAIVKRFPKNYTFFTVWEAKISLVFFSMYMQWEMPRLRYIISLHNVWAWSFQSIDKIGNFPSKLFKIDGDCKLLVNVFLNLADGLKDFKVLNWRWRKRRRVGEKSWKNEL